MAIIHPNNYFAFGPPSGQLFKCLVMLLIIAQDLDLGGGPYLGCLLHRKL
jgi:hypothetical protein